MTKQLLQQCLDALQKHHAEATRYSTSKQQANATCAEFKTSTLSELIESGYMHALGKETEIAIAGIEAALAQQDHIADASKLVSQHTGKKIGCIGHDCDECRAREAQQDQPAQEPDQVLCKFYQVTTFVELVSAQEHHINKLQAKLKKEDDNGMGSILARKSRAASDEWSRCTVVDGTVSEPQTSQVAVQPALSDEEIETLWELYLTKKFGAVGRAEALVFARVIEAHCRGGV